MHINCARQRIFFKIGILVNCHISQIFAKYCHIAYCHIFQNSQKIVIFKLSYKNMTIFANCHIFLKIVIFVKYDKKKTYGGEGGRLVGYVVSFAWDEIVDAREREG